LRVRDGEVATQDAAKMVTGGVGDMKAIDSYQYAGSMMPKRRRGQKGREDDILGNDSKNV
jgi:hypothetical protein